VKQEWHCIIRKKEKRRMIMSAEKVWEGEDGQLYAEDEEGHVDIIMMAGWDTGCPNCDYGKDEIGDLEKDSLSKAWNWYCENFTSGLCMQCYLEENPEELIEAIEEANTKIVMHDFMDPDMLFDADPEMSFEDLKESILQIGGLIEDMIPGGCPEFSKQTKKAIIAFNNTEHIIAILEGQEIPTQGPKKKFRGKI
jgi:hypothetical protein